MVMTYRGGFSTNKNGSFWHLLVVQVYLISNSHDSPLFKLLYHGCYMDSHGSKKYFCSKLISNLIRHLLLESCKMGEVASSKERKKN